MSAAAVPNTGVQNSTFDQIKNGAVDSVNWLGRKVNVIYNVIKDYIMKVVNWVKPFFTSIANFIGTQSARVRDFVVANKQAFYTVGYAIPVIAMLTLGAYWLLKKDDDQGKPTTKTA